MRRFFRRVVGPHIERLGYTRIGEIGAQHGTNTDQLLDLPGRHITIIDPCIDADLLQRYASEPRVAVERGLSLEVLPRLEEPFDCILIDGDHNWFTVFHELTIIEERGLLAAPGTIFLHDVGWPYARRDLYYDADTIPAEFRHPCNVGGVQRGVAELDAEGMNCDLVHATHEGGSRNGVLTAIEDFLAHAPDHFDYFSLDREFGLGVLLRAPAEDYRLRFQAWRYRCTNRLRRRITGRG